MAERTPSHLRGVSLVAILGVVAVVLGILIGRSDGYAATSVQPESRSVWVTNDARYLVGRVNRQIDELDSSALLDGGGYDVLQNGRHVVVVDSANHRLRNLDVATVSLGPPVTIPATAAVALGGDTLAVADRSTGSVWVLPADAPPSDGPTPKDPAFVAAPGVAIAVSADGTVAAVAPGGTSVLVLNPGAAGPRQIPLPAPPLSAAPKAPAGPATTGAGARYADPVTITMVGDTPVVLDRPAGRLLAGGASLPLPPGSADPVLQQPGGAADAVLVATTRSLLRVSLADGTLQSFDPGGSGPPAAPVWLDGCAHGAWGGPHPAYLRWCGSVPEVRPVPRAAGAGELVFRVNGETMVLNDVATGNVWVPDDAMVLVNNWQQVAPQPKQADDTTQQPAEGAAQRLTLSRTDCTGGSTPPAAVHDSFGIRAGHPAVLPVMGNDAVSACAVTVVEQASTLPPDVGTVQIVAGGTALQVTTAPDAAGTLPTLNYRISDGAGHSSAASVTINVVPDGTTLPPQQLRDSATVVAVGGTTTYNVLPDWISPSGDALYLTGAHTEDPGQTVSFTSDGSITVRDNGTAGPGKRTVDFVLSDGTDTAAGTLTVDAVADTDLVPVPSPVYARAAVGLPVTVHPLDGVLSVGPDPVRLVAVSPAPGVTGISAAMDANAGTVALSADEPGTYQLTFQVASGSQTADGALRVDVVEPSDDATPIAVTDTVYLPEGDHARVDLVANDVDPAGGVLAVQQLGIEQDSPLVVSLVDRHIATISARRQLPPGGEWLRYTMSGAGASAIGWIHVVPTPPVSAQTPIATPISVNVRAGDAVTVAAASAARDPGGSSLTVQPFDPLPTGSGLLFAAGDEIRYLAPASGLDQPVVTSYTVANLAGRTDTAPLQIRVIPDGVNHPPRTPAVTTARVFAGQSVQIALPLNGIDPDGDWAIATALDTAPDAGTAEIAGPSTISYTAPSAARMVTFRYTVTDPFGASSVGTVVVGVIPPPELVLPPIAPDLTATVAPGRSVAVDVLSAVTDPSGLAVDFADPGLAGPGGKPGVAGRISGGEVVVTAGPDATVVPLTYTVQNASGLTASGVIAVTVSADARHVPPTAQDVYVTPAMVSADGRTALVDVAGLVANPGGLPADLSLRVPPVDGTAVTVGGERSLRVQLAGGRQVLAYQVRNADDLTASAFIVVPGRDQLVPDNRLPGPSATASTAPSSPATSGAAPVPPAPTSTAPSAPATTTTSLPAPELRSVRVEVEAGGRRAVQLAKLVRDGDRYPQLTFAGPSGAGNGVGASISGSVLTVTAAVDAPEGTTELTVTVDDGVHEPASGTIEVSVKQTTAAPPTVPDLQVKANQGEPVRVNVLAAASNPLAARGPLTLTDATLTRGRATVSVAGGAVTVTPAADETGTVTVRATVTDAAGRTATGTITVSVLGKPDPPTGLRVVDTGDGSVQLTWIAPDDHGSPIGHYFVYGAGPKRDCGARTTCQATGLTNGRTYTFRVSAGNAVGESGQSAPSAAATPDIAPGAPGTPTLAFGDRQLTATWTAPPQHGSIGGYLVTVSPQPQSGPAAATTTSTRHTFTGLKNGQAYTVTVVARNRTGTKGPPSTSDPMSPATTPGASAKPQVDFSPGAGGNVLDVSWDPPADNGGDANLRYSVHFSGTGGTGGTGGAGSGQVDAKTARSATIPGVKLGATYTVWVVATNKAGAGPDSLKASVTPATAPATVAGLTAHPTGVSGEVRLEWQPPADNGRPITGYRYNAGAGWQTTGSGTGTGATISGLANGTTYTFSVRACNGASSCGDASTGKAASPYAKPGKVGNLSVYGTGTSGQITAAWTPPASNGGRSITGYQYRYQTGGGNFTGWRDSPQGSKTTFSLTDTRAFKDGTDYTFQVRAVNAAAAGDIGDAGTHLGDPAADAATPCRPPDKMAAPTGNGGDQKVTLHWTAPFNGGRAIDRYQYRIEGGNWQNAGSGTSVAVTGLKAGTGYQFQIKAHTSVGWSPASSLSGVIKTDPAPKKAAAQLVHGAPISNSQCSVSCYYFKVNYQNLKAGSYHVTIFLDGKSWRTYTWSLGKNGSKQATSYAGKKSGRTARVVLKGPSGTVSTGTRAWP